MRVRGQGSQLLLNCVNCYYQPESKQTGQQGLGGGTAIDMSSLLHELSPWPSQCSLGEHSMPGIGPYIGILPISAPAIILPVDTQPLLSLLGAIGAKEYADWMTDTCPLLLAEPLLAEHQLPRPGPPTAGVTFMSGDRHPDLRYQIKHHHGPHTLPSQSWAIKFTISQSFASIPPGGNRDFKGLEITILPLCEAIAHIYPSVSVFKVSNVS